MIYKIFLGVIFFASCSSFQSLKKNPYQLALEKASQEVEYKEIVLDRALAQKNIRPKQLEDIEFDFENLKGSFDVLVFPKISSQSDKTPSPIKLNQNNIRRLSRDNKEYLLDSLSEYASPQSFRFTAQRLLSCYQLLMENSTAWNAKFYFGDAQKYKDNKDLKCAIIEVKRVVPEIRPAQVKPDDVLAVRIYIDEYLRSYGQELIIADSQRAKSTRSVPVPLDFNQPMSSGLLLYPIDIPNFFNSMASRFWTKGSGNFLRVPNNLYVKKKMKDIGVMANCSEGYRSDYRDIFSGKVRIGWCQGHSWPTSVHTERYFSVIKRIKN